jgi:hypothetical protein
MARALIVILLINFLEKTKGFDHGLGYSKC